VRRDLRPLVVEERRAVGLVDDHRDLGVALVRAIADAEEAAAASRAVEEVEVDRLVEVLLGPERVGVVVLRPDVPVDLRHGGLPALGCAPIGRRSNSVRAHHSTGSMTCFRNASRAVSRAYHASRFGSGARSMPRAWYR